MISAKPQVALVRCADYDLARVTEAMRSALAPLGGMASFVKPGQRVLLKANLLRPASPETAATTHPAVVAAAARLVIEAGGAPLIIDSPGGPYSPTLLKINYRKSQMTWAAEVSGAELNFDVSATQVPHPEGRVLRRLDLIQPALDADVIINLPKIKTHNLTGLTLCVKNLFGLVPGALKIGYHAKMQEKERFCEGLVDIYAYVRPALNIVDGVVAMEGEGPSGGEPRELGVLLAGADALAVDTVAASVVGFDPLTLPILQVARRRGLCSGRLEDIELIGEPLDTVRISDFRPGTASAIDPGLMPRGLRWMARFSAEANGVHQDDPSQAESAALRNRTLRALSAGWLWRQLIATPRAGEECIGCGYCARHCPVQAIEVIDGLAHMDPVKCIRCYCCHELCPYLAVELYTPWLGRLLMGKRAKATH